MNVGGGGDISGMWVKGTRTGWISMTHNWGASYQAFATLGGQSLSFKITSYTTKETIIAWNVAPATWSVGLTYQTNVNFRWFLYNLFTSASGRLFFFFKYTAVFCLSLCSWRAFPCLVCDSHSPKLLWEQKLMPRLRLMINITYSKCPTIWLVENFFLFGCVNSLIGVLKAGLSVSCLIYLPFCPTQIQVQSSKVNSKTWTRRLSKALEKKRSKCYIFIMFLNLSTEYTIVSSNQLLFWLLVHKIKRFFFF